MCGPRRSGQGPGQGPGQSRMAIPGRRHGAAVAGARRRGDDTMAIATVNPATGETVKTYDEMSPADVERCLATAAAAHAGYRLTSFGDRAAWMRQAAGILDREQDQIAAMMTTEMGKTLAAGRAGGAQGGLGLPVLRRARRALPGR